MLGGAPAGYALKPIGSASSNQVRAPSAELPSTEDRRGAASRSSWLVWVGDEVATTAATWCGLTGISLLDGFQDGDVGLLDLGAKVKAGEVLSNLLRGWAYASCLGVGKEVNLPVPHAVLLGDAVRGHLLVSGHPNYLEAIQPGAGSSVEAHPKVRVAGGGTGATAGNDALRSLGHTFAVSDKHDATSECLDSQNQRG